MRIMTLGECVPSAWPASLTAKGDGYKYMTGTSCAATIAAGIVATILDYSRGFLTDEEWMLLRKRDSVRNMFMALTSPVGESGYWSLQHSRLFHGGRNKESTQQTIRDCFRLYVTGQKGNYEKRGLAFG